MTTLISQKEELIIEDVVKQPSLLLTMPFEPKLYCRRALQQQARLMQNKAEAMLLAEYTRIEVKALLDRLKTIFRNLNYNSYKKSLVAYISTSAEKVLYLDMSVEENVVLNATFHIRELIQLIQHPVKYLVCVLNDHWAKTYVGNDTTINLLKRDAPNAEVHKISPDHLLSASHKSGADSFYQSITRDFNILLNAYPLPVFVIGSVNKVNNFCELAKNRKDIVQVIYKNTSTMNEQQIMSAMRPYLLNWNQVRLQYLNKQLHDALLNDRVIAGAAAVFNHVKHFPGKLLIENSCLHSGSNINQHIINSDGDLVMDNYEESISLLIQQLLQNGGSVELVPDGFLKDFNGVAFITKHREQNRNYQVTRSEKSYECF
jgi:hypothetical protein